MEEVQPPASIGTSAATRTPAPSVDGAETSTPTATTTRLARGLEAGKRAYSVLDFGLRLAFFALAPQALAVSAIIFPIWGIVINVCVALVVFFIAKRVRAIPILSRVLGRALRFEAYYREHAPRPFLYYVFFPLLFPYWLIVGRARREVSVYRPFSGVPLVVLIGTNVFQYFARYRPEIPFKWFAIAAGAKLAVELAAIMLFLMPVATSVVTFERQGKPWHLRALLAVALVSTAFAIHRHVANPVRVASLETQYRAQLRTTYDGPRAHDTLLAAARAALAELLEYDETTQSDRIPSRYRGHWIEGDALDRAQEKLAEFYKPDEVDGFKLTVVRSAKNYNALLLFQARSGLSLPHVWIAVTRGGEKFADVSIPARELVGAQLGKVPKKLKRSTHQRSSPPPRASAGPEIATTPEPTAAPAESASPSDAEPPSDPEVRGSTDPSELAPPTDTGVATPD
ncbi:MAG: hypothetical protein U0414_09095 [Polyangiaceae bacterium]